MTYKNTLATALRVGIIYYWFKLMFIDSVSSVTFGSLRHLSNIAPALVFAIISTYSLFTLHKTRDKVYVISILSLAVFSSLINADVRSAISIYIFFIPVVAIYKFNLSVKAGTINTIFIVSVVVSIATYHVGMNEWGYIPGQVSGERAGRWWRVSLFPFSTPSYSGVFALCVFLVNYIKTKKSFKHLLFALMAFYFLAFSGSRAAIIVLISCLILRWLLKNNFVNIAYSMPIMIIVIVYLLIALPFYLLSLDMPTILNYIVYRSPTPLPQEEMTSLPRLILTENLLQIYKTAPLFGVGSFDLYDYFPNAPSHSENMWLSRLTRHGFAIYIMFGFFYSKLIDGVKRNNIYRVMFTNAIIIFGFFYGSFMNTYHFLFLLLISLSCVSKPTERTSHLRYNKAYT